MWAWKLLHRGEVMNEQAEFLFADGPQPELHLAHPLDDLFQAIIAAWGLPIGSAVRMSLRGLGQQELEGKLELVRAPDLPLDPREPLALRLCGVTFFSNEIVAWSLGS